MTAAADECNAELEGIDFVMVFLARSVTSSLASLSVGSSLLRYCSDLAWHEGRKDFLKCVYAFDQP